MSFWIFQKFIFHFRHPVGQRSIDEAVYDKLCLSICLEIGTRYAFFFFSIQDLSLGWILFCVQNKLRVDDISRKWKHVERTMNKMIPIPCYVQAADFSVASSFIFNCHWSNRRQTTQFTLRQSYYAEDIVIIADISMASMANRKMQILMLMSIQRHIIVLSHTCMYIDRSQIKIDCWKVEHSKGEIILLIISEFHILGH